MGTIFRPHRHYLADSHAHYAFLQKVLVLGRGQMVSYGYFFFPDFGLNNILFITRYIHAYIQTIQLTIGSDGKHSAYMKVISRLSQQFTSQNHFQ